MKVFNSTKMENKLFVYTGEWILIAVHLLKHIQYNKLLSNEQNISIIEQLTTIGDENGSLVFHIFASCIGSYAIYFGIGGFLHVILIISNDF